MIEFEDGAVAIGINRKQPNGFYVAVLVLPDGRVAAHSAPTRKEAIEGNIAALTLTPDQVQMYHGDNAP
jgi:hypothetical protein